MEYLLSLVVGIMWTALSMIAIRTMENFDGGSTPWTDNPIWLKFLILVLGPILYVIWERHILAEGPTTMEEVEREVEEELSGK